MNKVKVATVTGLLAALVLGAACGANQSGSNKDPEVMVQCFTADGKFVKWDDDCHDDKDSQGRPLVVGPPSGMQTAKQAAPTKAPTKAAPKPRRS